MNIALHTQPAAKPINLESLFNFAANLHESWEQNGGVDREEAEHLVTDCKVIPAPILAAMPKIQEIFKYTETHEEWDSVVVRCWPQIIVDEFESFDMQYGYKSTSDGWDVYSQMLHGETEWVATVATETLAENLVALLAPKAEKSVTFWMATYLDCTRDNNLEADEISPSFCNTYQQAVEVVWDYVKGRLIHACSEAFIEQVFGEDFDSSSLKTYLSDIEQLEKLEYMDWYFEYAQDEDCMAAYNIEMCVVKVPTECTNEPKCSPLNTDDELVSLAQEFSGSIALADSTHKADSTLIEAARRLVQQSTSSYSIIIPNESESIESGEGTGEWLPALVFIPNNEIFGH